MMARAYSQMMHAQGKLWEKLIFLRSGKSGNFAFGQEIARILQNVVGKSQVTAVKYQVPGVIKQHKPNLHTTPFPSCYYAS